MKIILIMEQDLNFPLIEGLRKQIWFTAKFLKKKFPSSRVIIKCRNSKLNNSYTKEGIEIINSNNFNFFFNNSDVLHYFGSISPFTYLISKFSFYDKFFITITDGEVGRFWTSFYSVFGIKYLEKKLKAIFIQTNYQKKILKKYFKTKLILNQSFMPEDFKKIKKKSKFPSLLFMSHLSPYKGIFEILKAYEILIKEIPDLRLIIADSGLNNEFELKVKTIIKKINNSGGNIILKGKVNPMEELSTAWIYLYLFKSAHNTYSVPLSLYESYLCKTLFISSNVGGVKDYFNKEFLLKENFKIEDLVKKIKYILKNKNKIKIKSLLVKDFNNELVKKNYLEEYLK